MPHIRHSVLIEASAEKIYNAITTQQGLSAWWTPGASATPEVNSLARFEFSSGYFKEMKVLELKPQRQVKWTCTKGADEWVGTTISFELVPGNKETLMNIHSELSDQIEQSGGSNGTLLIFHHDDWKEYSPMYAECNYTWGRFLRSLKRFCETGNGTPWPNQHRRIL
jgi:uncharacterized protein YndB with AHSA1/START domain